MAGTDEMKTGVIVVTYASGDVIGACLNSLLDSDDPNLRIAICDNGSPDDTCEIVTTIAQERKVPFARLIPGDKPDPDAVVTLISGTRNLGYAGGVNTGLRHFAEFPDVTLFWVLNPDCMVAPDASRQYAKAAQENPTAGLLTGRTVSADERGAIQSDGGWVDLRTGVCTNLNRGLSPSAVPMPSPSQVNFASGANVVCTREFLESVGLMDERYFLYYEEVDWAMRGAAFPIALCPEVIVRHHGGTAIGSGTIDRAPSAFSNYFNYRNRMWFLRRFNPRALPVGFSNSALRIAKLILQGQLSSAMGAARGLLQLGPPKSVAARLAPEARQRAFGRRSSG